MKHVLGHPKTLRAANVVLLLLLAFALFLFFESGLSQYLTFASLKAREHELAELYETSPAVVIGLFVLFTVSYVVCMIPAASVPMIISGALFGRLWGVPICALSLSVGAVLSLLLSRFVFRSFVRRKFPKQTALVELHYEKSGLDYLIAIRLLPVMPYFLTNLVFGLTPIKPSRFWLVSFIFSMPAVFLYASAGTELSKIESPRDILSVNLLVTLAGLAVLPFIGRAFSKILRR